MQHASTKLLAPWHSGRWQAKRWVLAPANPKDKQPTSSGLKQNNRSSPSEPEQEPPQGPNLPPQLLRMIAFLTEYGGVFGTAAVVTGWVTHVDPFGGLHWDLHDVLTGLKLFLPLMVFDALVMLPDYHIRPDISTSAAKVSVGDMTGNGLIEHNLRRRAERLRKKAAITGTAPPGDHSTTPAAPASSTTQPVSDDLTSGRLTTSTPQSAPHDHSSPVKFRPSFMVEDDDGNAAAGTNSFSKLVVRSKMTLEMLQQYNARDHPGRALSPTAEVLVIAVSALAEEMLWRAVGLTLLGLWLR